MKYFKEIYNRIELLFPYILRLEIKQWGIKVKDKRRIKPVKEAIEIIESRWPDTSDNTTASPIFVFSAGWRSGSTLLQRLIMSSNQVMIWGEPFNRANIVQRQMSSLTSISNEYPRNNHFLDERMSKIEGGKAELLQKFIPVLCPEIRYLKEAHRSFFSELFSSPAIHNGYPRWGMKEVRLGIEAAFYFKWLFPNAKFLFLYRDPYNAYSSLKPNIHNWSLYTTWPEAPIRTPYKFGRNWENLVRGYLDGSPSVNGLVINYEELCNGQFPLEKLEEYLDLKIDKNILDYKVGSTKRKKILTRMETLLIKRAVNPLAMELGYTP